MPNFRLSLSEAAALAGYVIAQARGGAGRSVENFEPGNARRGRELLAARGCLNCHELEGLQGRAAAPSLAAVDRSSKNSGCLADLSARRGAPDLGLSSSDRRAILSFFEEGLGSLNRSVAAEYAQRRIDALRCVGCHELDLEPDRWSLLAPQSDSAEPATIHLGRPSLTWAGEKLRPQWTEKLLAGRLDYKLRPRLAARMPSFAGEAEPLARGLAHQHGYSGSAPEPAKADRRLAEIGRRLTTGDTGFNCVACHRIGDAEALAGPDTETLDFIHVADRLRRGFFDRFMLDPIRLIPGTQMPQFVDETGKSSLRTVFDGDASRQLDAIWHYLVSIAEM